MDRYKKIEKTNPDATLGEGAYGMCIYVYICMIMIVYIHLFMCMYV